MNAETVAKLVREEVARVVDQTQTHGTVSGVEPLTVTLDSGSDVPITIKSPGLTLAVGERVQVRYLGGRYELLGKSVAADDTMTELGVVGVVPVGGIIDYWGDPADLPANWEVVDGTNGPPDLQGKFTVGADGPSGGSWDLGQTGGAVSHDHGPGTYSVPSAGSDHTHGSGSLSTGGPSNLGDKTGGAGDMPHPEHTHNVSGTTGSDTHSHDGLAGDSGDSNGLPPYVALYKIVRVA